MALTTWRGRALAFAMLAAIAPTLGGCYEEAERTATIYPVDLRERHPIILADGARVLDLFADGSRGLSARQRADLDMYLAEWSRYGESGLSVQVPVGAERSPGTGAVVATVKASAGGRMRLSTYQPTAVGLAAPVRLSFRRLQARVSDRCGLWPTDIGVSDWDWSNQNLPSYNFGCSLQANIAAQVADPLDLVRGRAETAPDTAKRMGNIGKLRTGTDPTTQYRQDGQNKISDSVGTN